MILRTWLMITLTLVVLATLSCGGGSQTDAPTVFTATDLFPIQIGSSWQMANKFGDLTTWTFESAPQTTACETGNNIILHIQKGNPRTYWGLGIEGAEDRFSLHRDDNGQWRSTSDQPFFPNGCPWCTTTPSILTLDWRPVDGEPTPNVIVPVSIKEGEHIDIVTHYARYITDGNTTECIATSSNYTGPVVWESHFSTTKLTRPLTRDWRWQLKRWKATIGRFGTSRPMWAWCKSNPTPTSARWHNNSSPSMAQTL